MFRREILKGYSTMAVMTVHCSGGQKKLLFAVHTHHEKQKKKTRSRGSSTSSSLPLPLTDHEKKLKKAQKQRFFNFFFSSMTHHTHKKKLLLLVPSFNYTQKKVVFLLSKGYQFSIDLFDMEFCLVPNQLEKCVQCLQSKFDWISQASEANFLVSIFPLNPKEARCVEVEGPLEVYASLRPVFV